MLGHSAYGQTGGALDRTAARFADRFTYLLRTLGDESEGIGHAMRTSAFTYNAVDAMIAEDHATIADQLP